VLAAARKRWGPASQPESRVLEFELVYFHPGESVRIDNDNMIKPIQDALKKLVYLDDNLINRTIIEKVNLAEGLRIINPPGILAAKLYEETEFLYIRVDFHIWPREFA